MAAYQTWNGHQSVLSATNSATKMNSTRLCYILDDEHKPIENDGLVISSDEFIRPLDMNRISVKKLISNELESVNSQNIKLLTSKDIDEHQMNKIKILDVLISLTTSDPLQLALQQEIFNVTTTLPDSNDDTILHYTANNGSIECLRYLLLEVCTSFPYEIDNKLGYSILHSAIARGSMDNVRLILEMIQKSEDNLSDEGKEKIQKFLNGKTKKGCTALHLCVEYKCYDAVRTLLVAGVKLSVCDDEGNTLLHLAAENNVVEYVKRVANYHITDRPDTKESQAEFADCLFMQNEDKKVPVLIAKEKSMIDILLKYSKSKLNEVVDKEMGNLIHVAAAKNNTILAQALIEKKVAIETVNSKGFSPLKIAAKRGNDGVVLLLLEGGANPNYIGKKVPGFSPLNNAAQFGQLGCVKLLINFGSNLVHRDMTNTALHSASYGGHPDVVEFLIKEAGMDVNQKNNAGKTPLYQSITQNHYAVAKVLLGLGADPNILLSSDNETLLHIAVREGRKEIMTMLLEAKASPDVSLNDGTTPLMLAIQDDHDDYIPLIMAHGITLAKKDKEGNTILHHVAKNNSCASAKYILRRIGVMKGITQEFQLYKNKNLDGKSPYDLAIECGNEQILKIFIKYAPKEYFKENSKELHRFYDQELYGTIKEVISGLVTIDGKTGKVSANLEVFESDEDGCYPNDPEFNTLNGSFLHKIENCPDHELKYHPLVSFLINEKLSICRWYYIFSLTTFLIFLTCLGYALIQASTVCDSELWTYDSLSDGGRAFCEIVCLLYVILFGIFGKSEFYFKWRQVYEQNKDAIKSEKEINVKYFNNVPGHHWKFSRICQLILSLDARAKFFFSAFKVYFKEPYRFIEVLARFSFYLFVILRISSSNVQWTFAGLSFIFFTLSLLKHTRVFPTMGSYVNTVLGIFSKEIPAFLVLIIIIMVAYIGGIHLAARQQPNPSMNQSEPNPFGEVCDDSQSAFLWFNPSLTAVYDLRRPLLSGIIFLLDGGPSKHENDIFQDNFFFTLVYLAFAFIIIVLMLNILIAQLVDAYRQVSKTRLKDYKMGLVVRLERSFIIWLFRKGFRKFISIKSVTMSSYYWNNLEEDYETVKEIQIILNINKELETRGKTIENEFKKNSASQEELRNKVNELSREMTTRLSEFSELKEDIMAIKQSVDQMRDLKVMIGEIMVKLTS